MRKVKITLWSLEMGHLENHFQKFSKWGAKHGLSVFIFSKNENMKHNPESIPNASLKSFDFFYLLFLKKNKKEKPIILLITMKRFQSITLISYWHILLSKCLFTNCWCFQVSKSFITNTKHWNETSSRHGRRFRVKYDSKNKILQS